MVVRGVGAVGGGEGAAGAFPSLVVGEVAGARGGVVVADVVGHGVAKVALEAVAEPLDLDAIPSTILRTRTKFITRYARTSDVQGGQIA